MNLTTLASLRRPNAQQGFTVVELLIVLFLIATLVSVAMPGVLAAQRHASQDSTNNLFNSLNDTCVHQARQFGSACLVYGYTVEYGDTTGANGTTCAATVHPWVILPNGTVQYQSYANNLKAEIGHADMWTSDRIELCDRTEPGNAVVLNGTSITTSNGTYLHVAYEPHSGFVHAQFNTSQNPTFTVSGPGGITSAASTPDQVVIETVNLGNGSTASALHLNGTGVFNVQGL
jgi:prepilin-type N-terminal cleavage/methylation domain-containing protein